MHNSTLSISHVYRQLREEALALVLSTSLLAFSTCYESTAFLEHVDPIKADLVKPVALEVDNEKLTRVRQKSIRVKQVLTFRPYVRAIS
jgi:hypothetical protein